MDTINLKPLIGFLKERGFEKNYEDTNKVELKNKELENEIGILEIPKQTSSKLSFNLTFNTVSNILLDYNLVEDFELKILEFKLKTGQDIFSIRFFQDFKLNIEEAYKTIKGFFEVYKSFVNIKGKEELANDVDYLLPAKGSFVLNFGLPKIDNGFFENDIVNPNNLFVNTLTNLLTKNEDNILNEFEPNQLKPFVKELRKFSQTVIGKGEIYNVNDNGFSIVVDKVSNAKRSEILEGLNDLENSLEDIKNIPNKTFSILGVLGKNDDRIKQVELETEMDGKNVLFKWSFKDYFLLQKLKQIYANEQDLILKDIEYIKFKNYFRILNAKLQNH